MSCISIGGHIQSPKKYAPVTDYQIYNCSFDNRAAHFRRDAWNVSAFASSRQRRGERVRSGMGTRTIAREGCGAGGSDV